MLETTGKVTSNSNSDFQTILSSAQQVRLYGLLIIVLRYITLMSDTHCGEK